VRMSWSPMKWYTREKSSRLTGSLDAQTGSLDAQGLGRLMKLFVGHNSRGHTSRVDIFDTWSRGGDAQKVGKASAHRGDSVASAKTRSNASGSASRKVCRGYSGGSGPRYGIARFNTGIFPFASTPGSQGDVTGVAGRPLFLMVHPSSRSTSVSCGPLVVSACVPCSPASVHIARR